MLQKIKGDSYFYNARQTIGIYIKDNKATLVDTGIDEDYARKVYNELKEKGVEISKIIITHSHGDHFGGTNLIKDRSGCKIYVPGFESMIMENPILEPIYLFGAEPIDELKDKFFMAKPIRPDFIINEDFIDDLKIIKLPGHSPGLVGVATPDNVLYASDSFFTSEVLDKYKIPYLFSVRDSLDSLERLKNSDYDFYVLAHGGLLEKAQARSAIENNIKKIHEVLSAVTEFLSEKNTIEGVLRYLSEKYDLFVKVGQYFLNLSIVKAYLSHLKKENKISCFIEGKELYWKKII